MKHLLKLLDWTPAEIADVLNLADQLKYEKKNGIEHHILKGKTLGMIFQKSSTRTRVSFEVGMSDPYHFSKTFKNIVGMSPSAYSKTAQK